MVCVCVCVPICVSVTGCVRTSYLSLCHVGVCLRVCLEASMIICECIAACAGERPACVFVYMRVCVSRVEAGLVVEVSCAGHQLM